jgi:hypothetical protein
MKYSNCKNIIHCSMCTESLPQLQKFLERYSQNGAETLMKLFPATPPPN